MTDDTKYEDCLACDGSGECYDCYDQGDNDCPSCGGSEACNECQGEGRIEVD